MSNKKMEIWNKVCETNPKYTKQANVKGNKITSIKPQSQIKCATEQFGPYGMAWGFKSVDLSYELLTEGLVIFKGVFYFPGGEFPILNSIGVFKDNAKLKIDDDFAKKVETDALTKALSKIGFNSDVFMGYYDDSRYVDDMGNKFKETDPEVDSIILAANKPDKEWIKGNWSTIIAAKWGQLDNDTLSKLNILIAE